MFTVSNINKKFKINRKNKLWFVMKTLKCHQPFNHQLFATIRKYQICPLIGLPQLFSIVVKPSKSKWHYSFIDLIFFNLFVRHSNRIGEGWFLDILFSMLFPLPVCTSPRRLASTHFTGVVFATSLPDHFNIHSTCTYIQFNVRVCVCVCVWVYASTIR